MRLFSEVLDAQVEAAGAGTAELTWPGGKRIRLVREDGLPLGGALHHVRFSRAAGTFSARDRERAAPLASRLGLTVELAGELPLARATRTARSSPSLPPECPADAPRRRGKDGDGMQTMRDHRQAALAARE